MFVYSNPIDPESFVGRSRELREIATRIAYQGQSTVISGEPRSGKTSLLAYLRSHRGTEYVQQLSDAKLTFVYLDAHALSAETAHIELWGAVLDALPQSQTIASVQSALRFGERISLSSLNHSVESALRRACELKQRVVVLIDEFDVLLQLKLPDSNQFFGTMRSLAAARSSGALALVVASRMSLEELDKYARNLGSPYFNFYSEVYLAPLENHEIELILQRGSVCFSEFERRAICELSGGFPYFVQAAAAALDGAYREHSSAAARAYVAQSVVQRETNRTISNIWAQWPASVRHAFSVAALDHLASQPRPGESGLTSHARFGREHALHGCARLENGGFIKQHDAAATVEARLMLAWYVNQHRSLAVNDRSWTRWLYEEEWFVGADEEVQQSWRAYAPRLLRTAAVTLFDGVTSKRGIHFEPDFAARRQRPPEAPNSSPKQVSAAPTRVFVSYSHRVSDAHKQWVLRLATRLMQHGIVVVVDALHLRLGQDLSVFMLDNIRKSDRVLIVCSSDYVTRTNDNRGGVDFERLAVAQEILRNTQTIKFIPILRDNPTKELPDFLGPRSSLDFDDDARFETCFERLLRELRDGAAHDGSAI